MKTIIMLSLITFLIACSAANETTKEVAPKHKPTAYLIKSNIQSDSMDLVKVIPAGYSIVDTDEGKEIIFGDFNADGKDEVAVLMEKKGDPSYDQSEEVILAVFTADRHGQLQIAAATKNLGGASIINSQSKKLTVKNNVLSYFHQSMRHDIVLKFRYEIKQGNFMLIGKDFNSYGGITDGPSAVSINLLTGIKIFNDSKWDQETEEAISLPARMEKFTQPLIPMSQIDWDRMYDGF